MSRSEIAERKITAAKNFINMSKVCKGCPVPDKICKVDVCPVCDGDKRISDTDNYGSSVFKVRRVGQTSGVVGLLLFTKRMLITILKGTPYEV